MKYSIYSLNKGVDKGNLIFNIYVECKCEKVFYDLLIDPEFEFLLQKIFNSSFQDLSHKTSFSHKTNNILLYKINIHVNYTEYNIFDYFD